MKAPVIASWLLMVVISAPAAAEGDAVTWTCSMRTNGRDMDVQVSQQGRVPLSDFPSCGPVMRSLALPRPASEWLVGTDEASTEAACAFEAPGGRALSVHGGNPELVEEACRQLDFGLLVDTAGTWMGRGDAAVSVGPAGTVEVGVTDGAGFGVIGIPTDEPVLEASAVAHLVDASPAEWVGIGCLLGSTFYELRVEPDGWALVRAGQGPAVELAVGPALPPATTRTMSIRCSLQGPDAVLLVGTVDDVQVGTASDTRPTTGPARWAAGFSNIVVSISSNDAATARFRHVQGLRPLSRIESP